MVLGAHPPASAFRLLVVLVTCFAGWLSHAEGPQREAELKAVLLFNFARFVDWPPDAFSSPNDPLVIGVLGIDPFGPTLEEAVRGEKVGGRPVEVRRCSSSEEARRCHILFVNPAKPGQTRNILNGIGRLPILTVGVEEAFLRQGGIVRLYQNVDRKIRVRINLDAAREHGLTISSKLLRVAEVEKRS